MTHWRTQEPLRLELEVEALLASFYSGSTLLSLNEYSNVSVQSNQEILHHFDGFAA